MNKYKFTLDLLNVRILLLPSESAPPPLSLPRRLVIKYTLAGFYCKQCAQSSVKPRCPPQKPAAILIKHNAHFKSIMILINRKRYFPKIT